MRLPLTDIDNAVRPGMGRRQPSSGAFTLIELLLAIAIMMGVIVAIYSSWTAIMRGSQVGLNAANDAQRTRMTIRTLEQALSSVVMFGQNAYYYGFECDNSGDFSSVSFAAHLPDDYPGGGRFAGLPFRRISFFVEQNKAGGANQLVMTQMPLLQALEKNEDPYSLVLAKEVNAFELEFWDTQLEDWTYDWTLTNQVPPLVRFTIGFGPPGKAAYKADNVVTKSVALASVVVPPEYQLPQLAQGGGGGRGGQGGPVTDVPPDGGFNGRNSAAAAAAAAAAGRPGRQGGDRPGRSGGSGSFSGGNGRPGGPGQGGGGRPGGQGGPGQGGFPGGQGGPGQSGFPGGQNQRGFGGQGLGGGGRPPGGNFSR